jgi:hypothetical protein
MPKLTRRGTVSRDILRPEYAKKYGYKRHNGDAISTAMADFCGSGLNFELPRMVKVAADNELGDKLAEWADERNKSNGMLRMLLGAQLRKRHRQGLDVVVGDVVIPGELVEKAAKVYVPKIKEPRRSIRELLLEMQQGAQEAARAPLGGVEPGHMPEPVPEPPAPSQAPSQPPPRQAQVQATPQLRRARRTPAGHRTTWSREDIPTGQR